MSDFIIVEHNLETGKVTKREMTEEEIAQREADKIEFEARLAEQEAKAAARQNALAKLAELGLTEEEIATL